MKITKSISFIENGLFFNDSDIDFILRNIVGSTYPVNTLRRRIKLLTPYETNRIKKLYAKINDLSFKIDNIIGNRAEIMNDKWP